MLSINVGGKVFTTKPETLLKADYFVGLLQTEIKEQVFVDRDKKAFRHVLNYLRDEKYVFPIKYLPELDFYGVPYPKYSVLRKNDQVNIYVSGTLFRINASLVMGKSRFLKQQLAQLYVGQDLHFSASAKGFEHLLARIGDPTHYIPHEHIGDWELYGGPLIKWTDDTVVSYRVGGVKFQTLYSTLCKIAKVKVWLAEGYMPNIDVELKGWRNLIAYLTIGDPALREYKFTYDTFDLVPDKWFSKLYVRCNGTGCRDSVKIISNHNSLHQKSGPQNCDAHVCNRCREKAVNNTFLCKKHTG